MNGHGIAEIAGWPSDESEQRALVRRAANMLRSGEVVAFPTDTVYGIAADPRIEDAVKRLYAIKGRSPEKAIALLVSDASQLQAIAKGAPGYVSDLVGEFWPGGLTVVVQARSDAGIETGQPFSTVGLRMPDHMIPLSIISEMGRPLATTSANLSGSPSAKTAEEVAAQIGDRVGLIIDGGPCPGGRDSTVIDVTTDPPTIRRLGAVSVEALERTIGPVVQPE